MDPQVESPTVSVPMDDQLQGNPDAPEAYDLIPDLLANQEGKDWLEQQVNTLQRAIDSDESGRVDWMKERAKILELCGGIMPPQEYPAEGAPSAHDPIMIRTLLMLVAKGWDQICPAKGSIINVHGFGPEDEEPAQRRDDHMNWQLREQIPNYILGHLYSYMQFAMLGDVFREGWWDPTIKATRFDYITADDVLIPYGRQDLDPLMRDTPRITRVLRYHRWKIEELGRKGFFHDVGRLFAEGSPQRPPSTEESSEIQQASERIEGIEKPVSYVTDGDMPRTLYRIHTWMTLPGQSEQKPVIFVYDKWSKIPLSLVIREEPDPIDKARFDAETQVWQQKSQELLQGYQQAVQRAQQQGIQANLPEPTPPPMPEPPMVRPLQRIIHYKCFPNPQGSYGWGVGHLLLHPTEFINALSNRFLNQAAFASMAGGFLPKGGAGKAKRGEVRVEMGKFIETELDASEMDAIKPFQFPPPTDALWKLIEKTKQDASTLIADVDTMSGEAGPTNETKQAAQQRMWAASQLITIIVRVYLEAMKEEPRMMAHDNSLFMPEEQLYWLTTPDKKSPDARQMKEQKSVKRSDYANAFDFAFTADQRLQTQPERVQTATNIIDRLMQSPYVKDAEHGPQLFYAAFAKLFKATEDEVMLQALGPPPPPPQPPQPPQPMSQEDENQGFFEDKMHPVLPDDPHGEHLGKIAILRASPLYEKMSAQGKAMLDHHERAHYGHIYKQLSGGGQQNGVHGPGNPAGPPATPGSGGPPQAPLRSTPGAGGASPPEVQGGVA